MSSYVTMFAIIIAAAVGVFMASLRLSGQLYRRSQLDMDKRLNSARPPRLDYFSLTFSDLSQWMAPDRKDFVGFAHHIFPGITSLDEIHGFSALSNKVAVPGDSSMVCKIGEAVFVLSSSKTELVVFIPNGPESFVTTYASIDPRLSLVAVYNELIERQWEVSHSQSKFRVRAQ